MRAGVRRDVEVQPLRHGAGAHVGVEDVLDLADLDTELLGGLATDRGLRVVAVEQAGGGLDQHPVRVVVDVGRVAELPGQQHGVPLGVVQQDRGPVAPVVGLALLGGPLSVAPAVVQRRTAQDVPSCGGELDVTDHHVGVPCEVTSDLVEAGPSAVVRDVDAGLCHLDSLGSAAKPTDGSRPSTPSSAGASSAHGAASPG